MHDDRDFFKLVVLNLLFWGGLIVLVHHLFFA